MAAPTSKDITQLLLAWGKGDEQALDRLAPLVYNELRHLARIHLKSEGRDNSLQTTDLINDVFLRLIEWRNVGMEGRSHFFGLASKLMRQVLVDHARMRKRLRRGGGAQRISFDETAIVAENMCNEFIALDDALLDLEKIDPRKCRIVEMRYFGGLSVEETAQVLKLSTRTVEREWQLARAWLRKELTK